MRKLFRALALSMILMAALELCACDRGNGARPGGLVENAGQPRIGLSMATMQEERWSKDRDIFVAKAKRAGAMVIVQNADNDPDEQYRQVQYLLKQDIDVLVIVCQDAKKAADCVALAKRSGVPVVCYDRLILNAGADAYVSFDHVGVGRNMGELLVEKVPVGNYVIINGPTSDYNSTLLNEGYKAVLEPYISGNYVTIDDLKGVSRGGSANEYNEGPDLNVKPGSIRLLGEVWVEDWRREDAYGFMQEMLSIGRIDAVIAANDILAEGAIEALAEWRRAGKVPVTGQDADLSACQRIVEGTQYMTQYKPIAHIAEEAVRVCMGFINGAPVKLEDTISDGKYDVPYAKVDTMTVTRENMEETVIKDGFHLREKVFRHEIDE